MNDAYLNDSEAEAQAAGSLLDWFKAGTDLYSKIKGQPANAAPAPPVKPVAARVGGVPVWAWVAGGVALLGGLLFLAFRKP